MSQVFENIDDLIQTLRGDLAGKSAFAIGVDGIDRSGKSLNGSRIARDLNVDLISTDCFLNKEQGTYVEHLRFAELAESTQVERFVIEGCCLLEVSGRLGISLTSLIYMMRIDENGEWCDQEECDVQEPVESLITRLDSVAKKIGIARSLSGDKQTDGKVGLTSFRKEIIRYHARYKPFDKADYLLRGLSNCSSGSLVNS